ncbi:hypothetical protein GCM10019059_38660 [Camelimonas fluminis]|nr:hypothetical protein GCM10019059_38660 [Camelimonas fluminis]
MDQRRLVELVRELDVEDGLGVQRQAGHAIGLQKAEDACGAAFDLDRAAGCSELDGRRGAWRLSPAEGGAGKCSGAKGRGAAHH